MPGRQLCTGGKIQVNWWKLTGSIVDSTYPLPVRTLFHHTDMKALAKFVYKGWLNQALVHGFGESLEFDIRG